MMKKLALAALIFALGSVAAAAADFNGKWTAEVQGRNGSPTTTTFTFTVDATAMTVTGTVSGRMGDMPISNGKVTADTITFDVVRNFNGNSFTMSYAGKADGDTIKFTRTFSAGMNGNAAPPPQEFAAQRAPAGTPAPAPPPAQ